MLEAIGLRLHAKNRIAGGENVYLWHLAEVIRKTGTLATLTAEDQGLETLFGDGYQGGSLPQDAQLDHFLALLRELLSGNTNGSID